jgi:hypothetical protein
MSARKMLLGVVIDIVLAAMPFVEYLDRTIKILAGASSVIVAFYIIRYYRDQRKAMRMRQILDDIDLQIKKEQLKKLQEEAANTAQNP